MRNLLPLSCLHLPCAVPNFMGILAVTAQLDWKSQPPLPLSSENKARSDPCGHPVYGPTCFLSILRNPPLTRNAWPMAHKRPYCMLKGRSYSPTDPSIAVLLAQSLTPLYTNAQRRQFESPFGHTLMAYSKNHSAPCRCSSRVMDCNKM